MAQSQSIKAASSLAKTLTRNEMNMLSLVHSALDLNPKLYNFTQWLNSPEFVSPAGNTQSLQGDSHFQGLPAL